MAYVPNASDTTEPIESRPVGSAALEFRTLKQKVVENSTALLTTLRDSTGEIAALPSAGARAGKALVFDAAGNPGAATLGDSIDASLRSDLVSPSGSTLVGYRGITVEGALDAALESTANSWIQTLESAERSYKLATLPASTDATYDHLRVVGIVGKSWIAAFKRKIELIISARNGLVAYYLAGPADSYPAHIDLYLEVDGSVSVYAVLDAAQYSELSVALDLYNQQVQVHTPPIAVTPTGTLAFSTKTAIPLQRMDASGNLRITADLLGNATSVSDGSVVASKLSGQQSGSAPIFAARAWVSFNGTGTEAIRSAGNVSSIVDNGIGDYTVNFTTPMQDASYSAAIDCKTDGVTDVIGQLQHSSSKLTSSVRIYAVSAGGTFRDPQTADVAIFR